MPTREDMNVGSSLDWACDYLEKSGDENPRLSSEWLITYATGLTRVQTYMNFDKPLTPAEFELFHDAVVRRGQGEPLQYVTGEMAFRHINVSCTPEVLIPRPETELLVEQALSHIDSLDKDTVNVLEVGCGSGCISCSIAYERSNTKVMATDISPYAISLTNKNIDKLGLTDKVSVIHCDLTSGLDESLKGSFDVLISNPPYIPSDVVPTLPREVEAFEPHLALDGGDDGLDIYRRLVKHASFWLRSGGMFCVELFETTLIDAASILKADGMFKDVRVVQDLTRRDRMVVGIRK